MIYLEYRFNENEDIPNVHRKAILERLYHLSALFYILQISNFNEWDSDDETLRLTIKSYGNLGSLILEGIYAELDELEKDNEKHANKRNG